MDVRGIFRSVISSVPVVDVFFRRLIWSRIHFAEDEIAYINRLEGRPIDVAVDVGAALGHYSWVLNRKARRVVAFEPGKEHADFLGRGLAGSRIELIRSAVGSSNGMLSLYTPGDDRHARASATLSMTNPVANASNAKVEQVSVVSLDSFLSGRLSPSERVDLIKIDVEGFEGAVLDGARDRIARDCPLIIVEIEARHNDRYADVFDLLRGMGYDVFTMHRGKVQPFEGTELSHLQRKEDLAVRISAEYRPGMSGYINNFTFVHPDSKLRL